MCTVVLNKLLVGGDMAKAGEALFAVMDRNAGTGEETVVDLDGVADIDPLFLKASLGVYMDKYGSGSLKGRLSFVNATEGQLARIYKYIVVYRPSSL